MFSLQLLQIINKFCRGMEGIRLAEQTFVCMCAFVHMCVCVFECMFVCMCVCVRERERESVCVCLSTCLCVYVCVCERERERECVCVFEYMFVHVCVYVYVCGCCLATYKTAVEIPNHKGISLSSHPTKQMSRSSNITITRLQSHGDMSSPHTWSRPLAK